MPSSLSKLDTTSLPKLKQDQDEPHKVAIWLVRLRAWSKMNGMEHYMFGTASGGIPDPPATTDADALELHAVRVRDGARYIYAAIVDQTMQFAAAGDDDSQNGPQIISYIRDNWCQGRSPSSIFQDSLTALQHQ